MADAHLRIKVSSTGARKARGELGSIASVAKKVAASYLAIKAVQLGREFIRTASSMEQFNIRMKVMLGSAQKGNVLFQNMKKYASEVPFEFKNIMESATQLTGVMKGGVSEVSEWMPLIGDLAAATGFSIESTTSQIIRMYSAGASAADAFREKGVLAMLGFQAGVKYSVEETRQMLMDAWKDPTSKFKGATDELKSSWEGLTSMMGDAWTEFQLLIMESGVFDYMKNGVKAITEEIKLLNENVKEFGVLFALQATIVESHWNTLPKSVRNLISKIYEKSPTGQVGSYLNRELLGGGGKSGGAAGTIEKPERLIIPVRQDKNAFNPDAISPDDKQMIEDMEKLTKAAEELKATMGTAIPINTSEYTQFMLDYENDLKNHVDEVGEIFDGGWGEIEEKSSDVWKSMQSHSESWANTITDAFMNVATKGKEAFADMAESILRDIARIMIKQQIVMPLMASMGLAPARALGGPVYAGQSYMVGERGPELFTPSAGGNITPNGGGGGVNVTVINNAGAEVTTKTRQGVNGQKELQILVDKAVKSGVRGGRYDSDFGDTFGLKRQGR